MKPKVSLDLVAAARWNLSFLRIVAYSHWLHHTPTLLHAIRRYDELWMPLISDLSVGSDPPILLPPLDIEWVWYCHTLNPVIYKKYCESKFSKLIGKPTIFNNENEEYALDRCKDIWVQKYPLEPYDNELDSDDTTLRVKYEDLLLQVLRQRNLYSEIVEPYMSETVYLIAARKRYETFLNLMHGCAEGSRLRFVPTADILLMWLSHLAYPSAYAADVDKMEEEKVVALWEEATEEEVEESKKIWERVFNQPYEKAGGTIIQRAFKIKPLLHWEVTDDDVNTKYKSMLPRFVLEVCVFVKVDSHMQMVNGNKPREFFRIRMLRSHKELKMDKQISTLSLDTWYKTWHLYCEFKTMGVIIELRDRGGGQCYKGSAVEGTLTFSWNDLLRETSLTVEKDFDRRVRVVSSITPPAQASYLLKCVPDRVIDDSGAMISDEILRMNQYRPQEGRWLTRTVLDHAGRECFVARMRVGGGFWRRGDATPFAVKWEDRIVEICEGSWSYVAGAIGRAPGMIPRNCFLLWLFWSSSTVKVVGTATPLEPKDLWDVSWKFSCNYKLMIRWESSSSMSTSRPCFNLINETCPGTNVTLVTGRKMQYQRHNEDENVNEEDENVTTDNKNLVEDENEDEEEFITLVRFSEENPTGKATALLNWKLLVVEFSPEEDAIFLLLLCITILRSFSKMRKKDIGGLLIRRRLKEPKLGARDWGSVTLHPSSCSKSILSPHLQPWYWNPKEAMASEDSTRRQVAYHSQAEGGDALFKSVIFS